ncbi:MAG: hypothetical protein GY754_05725 [bacterium]|nr:hypothetical protein [bacterium]
MGGDEKKHVANAKKNTIYLKKTPLKVEIKAENGTDVPVLLLTKDKKIKYKAKVAPAGGTYKWKVTGKISIVGSDSSDTVEIKGDDVSASENDSEITVEYKVGKKTATARIKVTVIELKIMAENGTDKPALFIAKGKKDKYKAVVKPAIDASKHTIAYKWKVTGGKTSITAGTDTREKTEIIGDNVSASENDSEITVEYKVDKDTVTAKIKVTIIELKIMAENGTDKPTLFIAKGKKDKYKAVIKPVIDASKHTIAYKWKVTGGKTSITAGTDTKEKTEMKGDTGSAAKEDTTLEIEYTIDRVKIKESIKPTVVEFKEIEAKLKCTPRKNADKTAGTANQTKKSTKDSKSLTSADIAANKTVVINIAKGCGKLELKADVLPADVTVSWQVERAVDDTGLTGLPTKSNGVDDKNHILKADSEGSFHLSAFVDNNGNSKRDTNDPGLVLNINMIKIEVMAGAANNKIIKRNTKFNNTRSNATTLVVDSGGTSGPAVNASYTDANFLNHAISFKVTVKLTGGGSNQRRGTDKVRLGYIHTTTSDSITGTYPAGKTVKEIIAKNAALPFVITTGTPAKLAFPVRDTRGAALSGAGSFIVTSSDTDKSNIAAGGLKRVVRVMDSPAIIIPLKHPVATTTNLTGISGSNDFDMFLSAYSNDFDENYAVVAEASWSAEYGTYTAAAGWTSTGAKITAPASMTTYSPPKKGEDTDVERCPPNFVDNCKLDAT